MLLLSNRSCQEALTRPSLRHYNNSCIPKLKCPGLYSYKPPSWLRSNVFSIVRGFDECAGLSYILNMGF